MAVRLYDRHPPSSRIRSITNAVHECVLIFLSLGLRAIIAHFRHRFPTGQTLPDYNHTLPNCLYMCNCSPPSLACNQKDKMSISVCFQALIMHCDFCFIFFTAVIAKALSSSSAHQMQCGMNRTSTNQGFHRYRILLSNSSFYAHFLNLCDFSGSLVPYSENLIKAS
jgi:hypothetical protein